MSSPLEHGLDLVELPPFIEDIADINFFIDGLQYGSVCFTGVS